MHTSNTYLMRFVTYCIVNINNLYFMFLPVHNISNLYGKQEIVHVYFILSSSGAKLFFKNLKNNLNNLKNIYKRLILLCLKIVYSLKISQTEIVFMLTLIQ